MLVLEVLEDRCTPSVILNGSEHHWSNATGDWTVDGTKVGHWGITNWHYQNVDDFDGDGRDEFVARETAGAFWMFDPDDGGNTRLTTWGGGRSWDFHDWVDVTGDGVDDVIGKHGGSWWLSPGAKHNELMDRPVSSNQDLANLIRSQIPGFNSLSYLNKARAILDWSSNHYNYAHAGDIARRSGDHLSLPLWEAYNLTTRGLSAHFCGGLSQLTASTLKLFGIDAFTVDFGTTNAVLSHTTVIAPVWSGSSWDYYLLDPTFDMVLKRADGSYGTIDDAFRGDALFQEGGTETRRNVASKGVLYTPTYGTERYVFNFRNYYDQLGMDADRWFTELLRLRIFYVGPSLSPTAATGFTDRIGLLTR